MRKESVSAPTTGELSLAALSLAALGQLSTVLYLFFTGQTDDFVRELHESPFHWIPQSVAPYMEGDWLVAPAVASALAGGHMFVYAALSMLITIFIILVCTTRCRSSPGTSRSLNESDDLIFPGPGGIRPVVKSPKGRIFRGIAPSGTLRLKRTRLNFKRDPQTPIEHLEAAAIEVLYAHQQWPADPAGHHSTANLYDHSLDVAQRLKKQVAKEDERVRRLARVVGLAHDIGKLIAFKPRRKRSDGSIEWAVLDKQYDDLSAYIVYALPEIHEISAEDQDVILTVLRYTRQSENIPIDRSSDAVQTLMRALKYVDGIPP